jgi:CelD/BcsL family acetyltransferase involved in cellulose biosynthesis
VTGRRARDTRLDRGVSAGDAAARPRPPAPPRGAPGAAGVRAELVDPLVDGRWESFVAATPGAVVFHHRAWLALLNRTYGFPMTACCVVDGSGAVRAGAPLAFVTGGLGRPRLTSVPLAHECAPLPAPEHDAVLAAKLVHALDELRRSLRMPAELRGPVAGHPSVHVSARSHAHRIHLDPDPDKVVRRSGRRPQILEDARRAKRDGFVMERRTDARALAELDRLRLETHRRRGLPTEPRRFILGLAHLFDRGLGSVMLLRDRRRAVAGAVLLCFNGGLVYGYDASDPAAPPRTDDLLVLEAIRWGCQAGMRTLDLGRTALSDAGLREFKLSWGAEESVLAYHQLRDEPPPARERVSGSWTGPLIRRSPSIVGRLLGEAHCRWAP